MASGGHHAPFALVSPVLSLLAVAATFPVVLSGQSPDPGEEASKLEWRQIGPAIMGGRVADLAVDEANPARFFVGTATGGLWRTNNGGQSWDPVFDDQPTSSIGAVSLAPSNPNVVWVGTGEPQNRQSSPYGAGVFRSTDGGNTWSFLGLEETRHIGGIAVHPLDPDVAYVAAVGHLFGPNEERGVYPHCGRGCHLGACAPTWMSTPGPSTWSWTRVTRRPCSRPCISGKEPSGDSAPTAVEAASTGRWDGGDTWVELREGLPDGDLGRVGLDVFRRDGNLVYAIVEARGDDRGIYRSRNRGEHWEKVSDVNPRPMYFSLIRIDPNDPERIYIGGRIAGRVGRRSQNVPPRGRRRGDSRGPPRPLGESGELEPRVARQ